MAVGPERGTEGRAGSPEVVGLVSVEQHDATVMQRGVTCHFTLSSSCTAKVKIGDLRIGAGATNTCVCRAELFHGTLETIITLLTSYTPRQNENLKKRKEPVKLILIIHLGLPGSPVVKALHFPYRDTGSMPGQGTTDPTCCMIWSTKILKKSPPN